MEYFYPEIKIIEKQVFIPTCPRSGSSALAGLLDALGAFGGVTNGVTKGNTKGQFENIKINRIFMSSIRSKTWAMNTRNMYDHMMSNRFSDIKNLRAKLSLVYDDHGYEGGVAYFKHAKFMFLFRDIERQIPESTWVIPMRNDKDVAESLVKARQHGTTSSALREINNYRSCQRLIEKECSDVHVIDMNAIIGRGDYSDVQKLIEHIGLEWNHDIVEDWIDSSLWHETRGISLTNTPKNDEVPK
jgi:hypothetical protein